MNASLTHGPRRNRARREVPAPIQSLSRRIGFPGDNILILVPEELLALLQIISDSLDAPGVKEFASLRSRGYAARIQRPITRLRFPVSVLACIADEYARSPFVHSVELDACLRACASFAQAHVRAVPHQQPMVGRHPGAPLPLTEYKGAQLAEFVAGDLPRSSLQPPLDDLPFTLLLWRGILKAVKRFLGDAGRARKEGIHSEASITGKLLVALGFELPTFSSAEAHALYFRDLRGRMKRVERNHAKNHAKKNGPANLLKCQVHQLLWIQEPRHYGWNVATEAARPAVPAAPGKEYGGAADKGRHKGQTELPPHCEEEMAQTRVRSTLWACALEPKLTQLVLSLPS